MKKIFSFLVLIVVVSAADAQSIAINHNGNQPNGRSILDVQSTEKGVMLPRMTSAQRNAIPVVPGDAGLMVFDTDKQSFFAYTGNQWMVMPLQHEKHIHPVDYYAPDGQELDKFGSAVAIYGMYAAIGAPAADIGGNNSQGAVYLFRHNGLNWEFHIKITAPDGAASDRFGSSVAISADHLAIGAPSADGGGQNDKGAVYIFQRQGEQWNQQVKLLASDGLAGDQFGYSLAMDGNKLLIGAAYDDNGSYTNEGSAYLFKFNGSAWVQSNKFGASVPENSAEFGSSVAIDGDYLAIGAPGSRENNVFRSGSVYVFHGPGGSNWILQQKLINQQPVFEQFFGKAVDLHGGRLVVGVPGQANLSHNAAGMVLIFARNASNEWYLENYNFSTEPQTEAYLGWSVAIRNNMIMGGAYLHDEDSQSNSGAVWVYSKPASNSSWVFDRKITGSNVERVGFFGIAMAVDKQNGRYVIGSSYVAGGKGKVCFGSLP